MNAAILLFATQIRNVSVRVKSNMTYSTIGLHSVIKVDFICYFMISSYGLSRLNPATYRCAHNSFLKCLKSCSCQVLIVTSTSRSSLDISRLNSAKEVDCPVPIWPDAFTSLSRPHFLALSGRWWRFLCLVRNFLHHTISDSWNFMVYLGRSCSSLSRDMPPVVFGLTSLGPPLGMVEMRRIPPSSSQTGDDVHFLWNSLDRPSMSFWTLKACWWMCPDIWLMEPSIHAFTSNTEDNSPTVTEGVYDTVNWSISASSVCASFFASLLAKHENIWSIFSWVCPTTENDTLICQKIKHVA